MNRIVRLRLKLTAGILLGLSFGAIAAYLTVTQKPDLWVWPLGIISFFGSIGLLVDSTEDM